MVRIIQLALFLTLTTHVVTSDSVRGSQSDIGDATDRLLKASTPTKVPVPTGKGTTPKPTAPVATPTAPVTVPTTKPSTTKPTKPTKTPPVATPVGVPVGVPVSVPVGTPVSIPVGTPVAVPVGTPVAVPVGTPVAVPVGTPVGVPVGTPVGVPVAVPVGTPVSVPVGTPVSVPVGTPVAVPVGTPVSIPVGTPVGIPVGTPVAVPVGVPLSVPIGTPVSIPVGTPVGIPVGTPVAVPVGTPVGVPVGTPVAVPVGTPVGVPVGTPVGVPVGTPVAVPVGTPVAVPVGTPVAVPVGTPVAVPVGTPVAVPVGTPVAVPVGTPVAVPIGTPVGVPVPIVITVSFNANVIPAVIYGSGNPNGAFTIGNNGVRQIQIGLRAKVRGSPATNDNQKGTYSFFTGFSGAMNGATWNFDFAVNSDVGCDSLPTNTESCIVLSAFDYSLEVDSDPSFTNTPFPFNAITAICDNSLGSANTASGQGIENCAAIATNLNLYTVAQNSFNFYFEPLRTALAFDPTVQGIYDITLIVKELVVGTVLDKVKIRVLVGNPALCPATAQACFPATVLDCSVTNLAGIYSTFFANLAECTSFVDQLNNGINQ